MAHTYFSKPRAATGLNLGVQLEAAGSAGVELQLQELWGACLGQTGAR